MHRVARILSTMLITAGVVVFADVGATLVWQEPVSAAYGSLEQGRASDELVDLESEFPASADLDALEGVTGDAAQAMVLADRFEKRIKEGDAIGRLEVDRIGLDVVFLQGTSTGTLQRGPGHYPTTQLPGQGGTVAIAGHRTTYLAPFRTINEIRDGDEVRLVMPYGVFTYEVEKHEIVEPTDVQIVDPVGYDRVVLTACHPLYSAAQRWVVYARLRTIETFATSAEGRWLPP
jgi:sortase A